MNLLVKKQKLFFQPKQLVWFVFAWILLTIPVMAQSQQWVLWENGTQIPMPLENLPTSLDSASVVKTQLLTYYQNKGYLEAMMQHIEVDSTHQVTSLWVDTGKLFLLEKITLLGIGEEEANTVAKQIQSQIGEPLSEEILSQDIARILQQLGTKGYGLAIVSIQSIEVIASGIQVTIKIEKGTQLRLKEIYLSDSTRTTERFIFKMLQLKSGEVVTAFPAREIQQKLVNTGLFESVGIPTLTLNKQLEAIISIPIVEVNPGNFDVLLGYLPPTGAQTKGSLVGNGRLQLVNVFGQGRRFQTSFSRLPGQVSQFQFMASDPFVFGLPFNISLGVEGSQRDSTYNKFGFQSEVGYQLGTFELFTTIERSKIKPGLGNQSTEAFTVKRATNWFLGAGLRWRTIDHPINPRRGIFLETNLEQGWKNTEESSIQTQTLRQRLRSNVQVFLPILKRQVFALGMDVRLLLADDIDESELYRWGGASTLRGYNEEQFKGNIVGRNWVEYRYQVEAVSYAYLFYDMGWIRTNIPSQETDWQFKPGFGFGIQYATPLGIMKISYAINPTETLTNGKLHLGLQVGL